METEKWLEETWVKYSHFEEFFFNEEDTDFSDFLDEWQIRLTSALDAGISYSESVLAFKLLKNSNLDADAQEFIFSALRMHCLDRKSLLLQTMLILSQMFQETDESEITKYLNKTENSSLQTTFSIDDTHIDDSHINATNIDAKNIENTNQKVQDQNQIKSNKKKKKKKKLIKVQEGEPGKKIEKDKRKNSKKKIVPREVVREDGTSDIFQCPECPLFVYFNAGLQHHLPVHKLPSRPFQCSSCSASYSLQGGLYSHKCVHDEPITCTLCDMKFFGRHKIKRHMRQSHKVKGD
ncbi:zinc finger protein 425 isoform X1 [Eurytemora carolleeae]|uniref:zinc finger protein 425 isoform X1 n=1 Tax=Eurytemora carolleeae TaxID=1294199 RepID=UPI000C75F647|nr:zinc finger protein 425 isoform X1 [Eurytemora carolleeae]XP_023334636.1 zinc finger protein 425 isoform X1 [Eurytemora carolleeae]|eukprot:XP_023334635.1 zinc finger protein 425-like isoform X1 [Eurytemora affinis]